MSQPPPLPPEPPLDYRNPKSKEPARELGDLGKPQVIFDTVGGPNLRLRDNLIQLVAIIVAIVLATLIAFVFTREIGPALVIGILTGLIGGVIISGAILGIYRFVTGVRRK